MLVDEEVGVRTAAVDGLGRFRGPWRAVRLAMASLRDAEPRVRKAAARALADLRDPSAVPADHSGALRHEFNDLSFSPGTVGLMHADGGDSGSAQFFITSTPTPEHDRRYTTFGRVTAGLETLENLRNGVRILGVSRLER